MARKSLEEQLAQNQLELEQMRKAFAEKEKALKLAKHLESRNIPVWLRHVLVPGITDSEDNLAKIGEFAASLNNVQRLELLPYHSIGVHKWESMGVDYELKDVRDADQDDVKRASEIIERYGVKVFNNK